MCQMNVVLEKDGVDELLMEGASLLECKAEGVELSSLFDPPRLIPGVKVVRIDFLNSKVVLGNAAGGGQ
jgi:predicted RNA-binding protein